MPTPLQLIQHGFRMPTVAQCCIKSGLSRLDLQEIQNLLYHNGDMHACGSVSLLNHMGYGIPVFFRL